MMCKDCIHFSVCKFASEEVCKGTKVKDLEHDCKDYQESIVEIVHCKDCKNYVKTDKRTGRTFDFSFYDKFDNIITKYDFCSYGERKDQSNGNNN